MLGSRSGRIEMEVTIHQVTYYSLDSESVQQAMNPSPWHRIGVIEQGVANIVWPFKQQCLKNKV